MATERSPLLPSRPGTSCRIENGPNDDADAEALISNNIPKDERALLLLDGSTTSIGGSIAISTATMGERLPFNDYTTIDWLRDLVKDHSRIYNHHQSDYSSAISRFPNRTKPAGLRERMIMWWDAAQGWVAAFAIGVITALIAFCVDVSVAVLADWKEGHCSWWLWSRDGRPCERHGAGVSWTPWSTDWGTQYAIYVGAALVYGLVAGSVTLLTRANLPAAASARAAETTGREGHHDEDGTHGAGLAFPVTETVAGKTMYMAAGSGIPEIKTILSGFAIPHFLDLRVLVIKAVGATFAVSTGMCLGKEGPFVHISTCVGYLVANWFPKYRYNGRKMREMLSVACSSGLSVAFGAPIGGVLFSYEVSRPLLVNGFPQQGFASCRQNEKLNEPSIWQEISTYFPRPVLWKAFLCSLVAAATLKQLNPTGTGKLVLFETSYGVNYDSVHYLVFILLGVCGGLFGGIFCQANFHWSKFFRSYSLIKNHPVLEVSLVVLVTALLQFPNHLIRSTGDVVLEDLLIDCKRASDIPHMHVSYVCEQEALADKSNYFIWLATGTFVKLVLITVTFGCKVPSGIIIPALDAGALFGRMVGQTPFLAASVSPGIFAMVGAAAFLAGVSRMTVSLAVIMFELTGEVNFILPFMVAILTSKWVADAISREGVYDLGQHLLGLPFLDMEQGLARVKEAGGGLMEDLLPPKSTMEAITVHLGPDGKIGRGTLWKKLAQLKERGLMDGGLVLVTDQGICHGYLPEGELEFALRREEDAHRGRAAYREGRAEGGADNVDLLRGPISQFVDRTPLIIFSKAPVAYAVEMFGRLGLRYLVVVQEDTARVLGVVIKKRLVKYLDELRAS